MRIYATLLLMMWLTSCKKDSVVEEPNVNTWDLFNAARAAVPAPTQLAMEGVYTVDEGAVDFGSLAALKWSYVIVGNDTTWHISAFFGKDIAYFIGEGKLSNGEILLNGYWRKMVSTETGLMRCTIAAADGAGLLQQPNPLIHAGSVIIKGLYGNNNNLPDKPITLTYTRKLNQSPNGFKILAHRSGGRTSDLLPVSENSVAMILKTAEFGSTGIEIDVRFTKDGVPVLYHDNDINLRLVQKCGLVGPIENYTYQQLNAFVRLIHGERIPTLQEALTAVVDQTNLSFVWLDTKYIGSINPVRLIQQTFLQRAAARGRQLEIVIGLPAQEQLDAFLAMPNYQSTPSLCELTLDDVATTNAAIWAPRFTLGTQNDLVDQIHAQGKRAFVWTVDVPPFIERFINDGRFDGILSNYPSSVAFYHYVKQ